MAVLVSSAGEGGIDAEFRRSVRRVLAVALGKALKLVPGTVSQTDVARVASELEAEFYQNHVGEPLEYCYRATKFPALLSSPRGEYLETSLGATLLSGDVSAAEASAAAHTTEAVSPGPRTIARAMFYRLLGDGTADRGNVASELERGCFNKVIDACEKSAVICRWEVQRFLDAYGSCVGRLAANLDPAGAVARSVGYSPVKRLLETRAVMPGIVGALDNDELCHDAHRKTKDLIQKRQGQEITEKYSKLYQCPLCRIFDCTFRLVQTRSLDEPASIYCVCRCGNKFQA